MLSGVSFDNEHVMCDWGVLMASKVIGAPSVKTQMIDIPGRDGKLDVTDKLFGKAAYGNRTITITLITTDDLSEVTWAQLFSSICESVHGKKKKIIFDDDDEWYYEGRCAVTSMTTRDYKRTIVISCDCDPYKRLLSNSEVKSL